MILKRNLLKFIALMFLGVILLTNYYFIGNSKKVYAEAEIWDGRIATEFAGGTGTENNPYQIANGAQLALLAQKSNETYKSSKYYYKLVGDIYLNKIDGWEKWINSAPANIWTPIPSFDGYFDGNGYTIFGLYCKNYNDVCGLFGYLSGSIKNVRIEKSYFLGNSSIVYNISSTGTVDNCYNSGTVYGEYNIGGIASDNYGTISNSQNTGKVFSDSLQNCIGGITASNRGKIIKCSNIGNITAKNEDYIDEAPAGMIGGIVGYNSGSIVESYNAGNITSDKLTEAIGGVCGFLSGGSVINSYNKGNIKTGNNNIYIGGIVGEMYDGYIKQSYNKGAISTGNNNKYIGGVLGGQDWYYKNSSISNCYNTASINTKTKCKNIGGIAGIFENKLYNCYNKGKIKVNYSEFVGGIVGKTLFGTIYNCSNKGSIEAKSSNDIGGIAGILGVYAVMGDEVPDIEPKIINCSNIGNIAGDKSAYVGGIVGESYYRSYNSYNAGTVTGYFCVGGIIGRKTLGANNLPSNCYYLKGSAKVVKPLYKDDNKPNTYGTELIKSQMKSTTLTKKLNKWVNERKTSVYSLWSSPSSKFNNGYPYLKNLQ